MEKCFKLYSYDLNDKVAKHIRENIINIGLYKGYLFALGSDTLNIIYTKTDTIIATIALHHVGAHGHLSITDDGYLIFSDDIVFQIIDVKSFIE
jgi:hypothetical protein